jgi:hypothetical protein
MLLPLEKGLSAPFGTGPRDWFANPACQADKDWLAYFDRKLRARKKRAIVMSSPPFGPLTVALACAGLAYILKACKY